MTNKEIQNKFEKLEKRVNEIEVKICEINEQIKPEPRFEKGQLVNFMMCGREFNGEINGKFYDDAFFFAKLTKEELEYYRIKYLDKNNNIQYAKVHESDIWTEELCPIEVLYAKLEELEEKIETLTKKK